MLPINLQARSQLYCKSRITARCELGGSANIVLKMAVCQIEASICHLFPHFPSKGRGIDTVNTEPSPGVLLTDIMPPIK